VVDPSPTTTPAARSQITTGCFSAQGYKLSHQAAPQAPSLQVIKNSSRSCRPLRQAAPQTTTLRAKIRILSTQCTGVRIRMGPEEEGAENLIKTWRAHVRSSPSVKQSDRIRRVSTLLASLVAVEHELRILALRHPVLAEEPSDLRFSARGYRPLRQAAPPAPTLQVKKQFAKLLAAAPSRATNHTPSSQNPYTIDTMHRCANSQGAGGS